MAGTGASLGLALTVAGSLAPWMFTATIAAAALAFVSTSSRQELKPDAPMRERVRALNRIDGLRPGGLAVPLVSLVGLVPLGLGTLATSTSWGGSASASLLFCALLVGPGLALLARGALHFSRELEVRSGMGTPEVRKFSSDTLWSSALATLALPGLVVLGAPQLLWAVAVPTLTMLAGALVVTPAAFTWMARVHAREQQILQSYRTEYVDTDHSELVLTHAAVALDAHEALEFRAGALESLIELGSHHAFGKVLDELMTSGPAPLAAKALQAAESRRYTPPIAVLDTTIRRGHPTLCGPAIRLAVQRHRKKVLPWLLRWLELPLNGVRVPVLEALGRVGDRETVAAIHASMTQPGADFFPVAAARAAMAEIQERLRLAPATGALAVIEPPGGELGLADSGESD